MKAKPTPIKKELMMSPEEQLTINVEGIVNHVLAEFPGFIQKMLHPYKQRLVRSIVMTSSTYVNAKILDCYKSPHCDE